MGLFQSSETQNKSIPIEIQNLLDRHFCLQCILRILSIGKSELSEYNIVDKYSHNCSACSGILTSIPKIIEECKKAISRYSFYDIQIEIPAGLINKDKDLMIEFNCQPSCNLKNYIKAILLLNLRRSKDGPLLRVTITNKNKISCELHWPTLYITGRYIKESRRVSHARFMPGVQPVSSVEAELIYAFNGHIKCTDIKFQSAGREDMDVRMIGSGRPFSLTFLNPVPDENKPAPLSKQQFLQSFQEEIPTSIICNYGVSAYDLQATMQIPDMQPKHVKEYQCVVCCSRNITDEMLNEIDSIENLTIQQKTPSRVAHRREMMYREKTILKMVTQRICANFFLLRLRTSSGTYIKEFVNSDFGRTRPSLGMILDPSNPVECQLMQLDVIYVGE